jgi:hypothetical protein
MLHDLQGLIFSTCLFAAFSFVPMLKKTLRVPFKRLSALCRPLSTANDHSNKVTLVDFKLPVKGNEIMQNLVNDEIISSSIIGPFVFFY